jgi:hypothetical protein
MKVPIKLSYPQLQELIAALNEDKPLADHVTITDKVNNYILLDVLKKLIASRFSKMDSKPGKTFSISLKYQEAAILWEVLGSIKTQDNYRNNCILLISNQIHKKL